MKAPTTSNTPFTPAPSIQKKCLKTLDTFLNSGISTKYLYVKYPSDLTRQPCWASGPDYSAFSPWNSYGITKRAGTLIGDKHALFAQHYSVGVGKTVKFISMNGIDVIRTIVKTHTFPRPYSDIWVVEFDRLIDDKIIKPASIFTRKLFNQAKFPIREKHMAGNSMLITYDISALPVYWTDAQEKLNLAKGDFIFTITNNQYNHSSWAFQAPTDPAWLAKYEAPTSGDSGSPAFFVFDNTVYLLGVFSTGGAGTWIGEDDKMEWLESLGVFKKHQESE